MRLTTKRKLVPRAAMPILLALGVNACRETLNEAAAPQGVLTEATLATRQGVEGSLIGAYRSLDWNNAVGGGWGWTASSWVWGSVPSDDAYKGSEATDIPNITDVEQYNWATGNVETYLNDAWRGAYEGAARANATLRLLKQVRETRPTEVTATDAASIAGEALFLRAHYHFIAWRMWGNIPYYVETDEDFRKPNLTSAEVVTSLVKDLDSAAVLLPTAPRGGARGRATKWTARAYKGRVQVYAKQWPQALVTLREVQSGGPYALEASYNRVWTGFKEFYNGKETIVAYQAAANDAEPNGNNANYGERLNFPHSGSPLGCCGFHQPSQNLVNFYAVDATGLPRALSDASWNANDANVTAAVTATLPVDPRLDWTVGRDGVPYKDWGPHQPTWIRAPAYGGFYSPKKNVHEKASGAQSNVGWFPAQLNSVRIHIFRYADMLLMLAEAEVEAGSLENARTIVNQIRTRAGAAAQGPGTDPATIAVPINSPSITWAQYRIGLYTAPFASQAAARTAVRFERRLELAMEGQRFFDLRRWGTLEETLNPYLDKEKTRRSYLQAASPVTARHQLYPIPNTQIQLSRVEGEERLKQNPGW
ncbi:MAG: RagB/SusD family nutrient uptake outer membrane protein [Gemmatimonadetes bacterium]|nr:RagB/SusD family nutrient uptake outer membrane protein [Gemmatimonadota bacterium]